MSGQPEEAYVLPARSPPVQSVKPLHKKLILADSLQKFKLIMILLLENWLPTLHCVLGKNACGFPQLLVSIVLEPCRISLGVLLAVLDQNLSKRTRQVFARSAPLNGVSTDHIFTSVAERSLAKKPPWLRLKLCPKLSAAENLIPHPMLLFTLSQLSQLVARTELCIIGISI